MIIRNSMKPGTVAQTCNPSCLGGRDGGGMQFKINLGKKFRTPSQEIKKKKDGQEA
jgi:hypothetical protein